MAVEITFFQGIAVVVLASVGVIVYFLRIVRDLENKVESVTVEKAWIVDESLVKRLIYVSFVSLRKMVSTTIKKEGEKTVLDVVKAIPTIFTKFLEVPKEQVEKTFEPKFPKELVETMRLEEEEKDRLFNLTWLAYALQNLVPERVSNEVDKLTKAIICGVLLGLLIPTLDFFSVQNLEEYLGPVSLVLGIILVTGYYYVKDGIMGIWSIRKFEKSLKKLKRAKNPDEIAEYKVITLKNSKSYSRTKRN